MNLRELQHIMHHNSVKAGWWDGELDALIPTKLLLIHSEISEAMEGHRKGLMDDHIPGLPMMEVELADAVIRIADLAQACGYDLEATIQRKNAYNLVREDHTIEHRQAKGGKKY